MNAPALPDGLPPPPAAEAQSLGGRAARGAAWTMLGYGGAQVLRFVGNLVLTRLLFEEAFGMMALVNVFLQGLQLFSDIGIGPSIIQNARGDDPRFLNTAWTVQIGRGVMLWLCACAGAVPFAAFYGEPDLALLLPVSGLAAVLSGFNSTKLFTLNRHLNMKRLVVVELGSQASGLVVMVTWGLLSPTLWALVAGGVITPFAKMALSHLILPGPRNRPAFERSAARALFSFGRWIFFSTVLTFFASQSDRLVFGKLIPLDVLGVYSIGLMISTMPSVAISHLASSITFPLYSRVVEAQVALAPVFARVRFPFLLLGGWSLSGLCGGGTVAIGLLYDERYESAGWIVQLLAVMAWFSILEATNGSALLARGKASLVAASSLAKLVGMVVLIPVGHQLGGFQGAVAGYVAAEGLKYGVSALAALRDGLRGWRADLSLTLVGAVASLGGWVAASAVTGAGLHLAAAAAAVFVTVSLIWAPVLLPFVLKVKREGNPLHVDL